MTSVILDTSYCIHLVNEKSSLHNNAWDYFSHFVENAIVMYLSTIVISEYSVKDSPENLPIESFRILTFDYQDSVNAGNFMRQIYEKVPKEGNYSNPFQRTVVKNDVNLLAQAYTKSISGIIAIDSGIKSVYIPAINEFQTGSLTFIDLKMSCETFFQKQLKIFPNKKSS
jgi:hypothetical protein